MKKLVTLTILSALLMAQLAGCGATPPTPDAATTTLPDGTTAAETDYSYPYPTEGYGGEEFGMLNIEDIYTMHCQIDREQLTGDVLDDALFNRNKLIETKFDIVLKEHLVTETWEFKTCPAEAQKAILAGDSEYDVMFIPVAGSSGLITDGAFIDLKTVDSVQLDKPWWYSSYNDAFTLNGKLYGAMGGAHLCIHDGTRVIAFNSDMMKTLGLDLPYDIVREGKWTLDVFNTYLTAAANLNGDDSAAWLKDGKTVYGFTNNQNSVVKFMQGFGENMVEMKNGKLVYTAGSERFHDSISKLAKVLTVSDAKGINAPNGDDSVSDDGNPGYLYIFTSKRALFSDAEVNKFQGFRTLDFEYGIIPYPKYDENQENYYCDTWQGAPAAFIPVTSKDPEKVGLILDAMAYEGERTVVPAFRKFTVEQKGLRNDDSIEMLEIVTKNIVPVYYALYGISDEIYTQAGKDIWLGENSTASVAASEKTKIETQIKEITEKWK